jgi:hypothetical protein
MKEGWLARGLEAAKAEAQQFPEYRVKALSQNIEFQLKPSNSTKDARVKPRVKAGA